MIGANSFDTDKDRYCVRHDLGPNCQQGNSLAPI